MKTEEIFEMLLGIDENLISSVGEDLENYRYSVGKAYPADEKRGFSWKRVCAAVVFAAAVIVGALFIVKYFDKTDIPIDNSSSGYSSDAGSSSTPPPVSGGETSGNTPQTKPMQGYYDEIFEEITPENPTLWAPPPTFDEVMNEVTDPQYGGLDSFYLVEAVEIMIKSESGELIGFNDWFYDKYGVKYDEVRDKPEAKGEDYFSNGIIYRVKVIEDLISGEKCDYEIYTDVYTNGPISQSPGDPPYAPGERFTLLLCNKAEGSEVRDAAIEYIFRLDVKEIDGVQVAFARRKCCGMSYFTAMNFDGTEKISETVVTSTTGNPVTYNAKIKLSDFSDFLRRDWLYRGVGSNAASTGYDEDIQSIVEEYQNAGVTLSDEQLGTNHTETLF